MKDWKDHDPNVFFEYLNGELIRKKVPEHFFANKQAHARYTNKYVGTKVIGNHLGYKRAKFAGKFWLAHHLVWWMHHGSPPKEIDHINGNRQDNSIDNLREVTRAENTSNRKLFSTNKSGCPGVTWHSGNNTWVAKIRQKHLGSFANKEDAIAARKQAEILDGKFHQNHGRH